MIRNHYERDYDREYATFHSKLEEKKKRAKRNAARNVMKKSNLTHIPLNNHIGYTATKLKINISWSRKRSK